MQAKPGGQSASSKSASRLFGRAPKFEYDVQRAFISQCEALLEHYRSKVQAHTPTSDHQSVEAKPETRESMHHDNRRAFYTGKQQVVIELRAIAIAVATEKPLNVVQLLKALSDFPRCIESSKARTSNVVMLLNEVDSWKCLNLSFTFMKRMPVLELISDCDRLLRAYHEAMTTTKREKIRQAIRSKCTVLDGLTDALKAAVCTPDLSLSTDGLNATITAEAFQSSGIRTGLGGVKAMLQRTNKLFNVQLSTSARRCRAVLSG